MPAIPVKFFSHDMLGAPQLSGSAGALIAVLDACLLTGFNVRVPSSFVIAGGVGTLTFATAPGYIKHQVIAVAGADSAQYNTTWRVTGVSGATITVDAAGVADATVASAGGLSARVAPLGWQKAFSGVNLAAYKSGAVDATGCLLRVDDTTTTYASVRGYEAMSDIDTGIGMFPTTTQLASSVWGKSAAANSSSRQWTIVGDDRFIYLVVHPEYDGLSGYPNNRAGVAFGDLLNYKPGDAFHAMLSACNNTAAANFTNESNGNVLHFGQDFNSDGYRFSLARSFTQVGGSIRAGFVGAVARSGYAAGSELGVYPNPGDNSLLLSKLKLVLEVGTRAVRGEMPGFFTCLQVRPLTHGLLLDDVVPGKTLMVIGTATSYGGEASARWMLDITGPWR